MPDTKTRDDNEYEIDDDSLHSDRKIRDLHEELWRLRKERRLRRKKQPRSGRSVFWGLMLILWAVIIILAKQKVFDTADIWKYFLIGLGSIFIIQAIVNYFSSLPRIFTVSRLIPGFVLLFIGLGFVLNFNAAWPVGLVIAGIAVLFFSWFAQREVEKRKTTQENLHESEVKYRHIIDNANSIIMEIDTTANITFINKSGSDFFGFKEEELLEHNMAGTILPYFPSAGQVPDKLVEDIAAYPGKYLHYEQENLRKNGEKVWITWTYKPIFDEAKNLKEVLCIGIDSTQQKNRKTWQLSSLKKRQLRKNVSVLPVTCTMRSARRYFPPV